MLILHAKIMDLLMLRSCSTKCHSRHVFTWNTIISKCTHDVVMQELTVWLFHVMRIEMPALKQSSPSTGSKGASLGKVPSTITYSTLPSNFRHQTLVSPVLFIFLICALHLHIHVFCYFDKHMCQLLSSRSNFPFDVFSFRLLINFRCLLNCQRKYAGIKTTE